MTCAAGSQPEALCAVVASHISICSKCQRKLRQMQTIGEALFEDLAPTPMERSAPAPSVDNVALPMTDSLPEIAGGGEVPPTLRHILGDNLDALPWVAVAPGIHQYKIDLSPEAGGDVRILRLAAGASILEHGHDGEELSLVLRGSCRDGHSTYAVGDFIDLDDETRHTLEAEASVGCIIIIGSEKTPEFAREWGESA
jgi:putative transcriptional regulator